MLYQREHGISDGHSMREKLRKLRDVLYEYDRNDRVYLPGKVTYAIAFSLFAVSAFMFACLIFHEFKNEDGSDIVPYIGDPQGIITPIAIWVMGFVLLSWSSISALVSDIKRRAVRRREIKFLLRFRHTDAILSRECAGLLDTVIYDPHHESRRYDDYILVHDAGWLLHTLSLEHSPDKTEMLQEMCFPEGSDREYHYKASEEHIEAGKEFLRELEAVCRIWEHSLKLAGINKLEYCPHKKRSRVALREKVDALAKEFGTDQALELYYDGVPVEDIIC